MHLAILSCFLMGGCIIKECNISQSSVLYLIHFSSFLRWVIHIRRWGAIRVRGSSSPSGFNPHTKAPPNMWSCTLQPFRKLESFFDALIYIV